MNPRRKKRLTIVITLLIGFSAISGLVLYALSQNIDLFYKPSEIHFGKVETGIKPEAGQRLRIGGIVVPGSVKRDPTSLKVSFDLVDMATPLVFNDTDPTVTVTYSGILPDLFREEQGIVANGTLQPNGSVLASEVLAKHDENYMPQEISDQSITKEKYQY
ncbi:cytochrome c maturation protein CcmE [Psychrosphaera haliotis]|uniref:Cytochrome c-type biogenesis protein CcmE n=1 Tax=Psychrosphaera haliotis TaxID=555083 RepID=A0A6N8FAX8_9GAMM|nr:cytochrome c maturation protein CcmE [Psychrosphaera haliotis]MUH73284.1 cytochrome c maturation protein CcmE [Psychrosphaera haliotis]